MLEAIFSMSTLWWICSIIWFLACVLLVGVVLMQKGKGAGFAGAFGVGGGSDAVFGPRGRKTAIVQLTYYAAAVFMVLSLTLSIVVGRISRGAAPDLVDETVAASDKALDELFDTNKTGPATEGAASAAVDVPVSEGASTPTATPEVAPTDAAASAPAGAPVETPPAAESSAPSEPAPAGQ